MAVTEELLDPPDHWPSADEIASAAASNELVLLPDRLTERDGVVAAAFRGEAQALRVRAQASGHSVLLLAPEGAELAVYSEHAADWVLPVVVAAALAIPGNLVADLLHDAVREARTQQTSLPVVKVREAVVTEDRVKLREIEGPADEVAKFLEERRPADSSGGSQQGPPRLTQDAPPDVPR